MITADGINLDDPAGRWWVSDRTGENGTPETNLVTLNTPHTVGETDAPSPGHGATVWPLIIRYAGKDYAETLANRTILESTLLGRHRPVVMVRNNREASGMVIAGTEVERISYGQRVDVAYPFRIPAGRWFDPDPTSVVADDGSRISGTTADGTYQLAPLLGGTRDMDPTITTLGNGSNTDVRVTDVMSGQWVRIAGNIILGTPISIDPLALTATAGGTPVSGLLDFSPRPFHLTPQATVRVQRNGTQPVTITARRAYT